jgi:hypothetical protein
MRKELYRKPGVLEIVSGWSFSYGVMQYHDEYTLILSFVYLTVYISLPNFGYDFDKWDRSWKFYYYGRAFWFCWGEKCKCWHMPWSWEHVRHEVMFPDGLRKPPGDSWKRDDGRIIEHYNYTYTRENGEIQHRIATVYEDEREWRWRWFQWLPWPRRISHCIDVSFDEQIGEKVDTWKGGCVGCGYEMKPGESMEDTLRRMERERKFK